MVPHRDRRAPRERGRALGDRSGDDHERTLSTGDGDGKRVAAGDDRRARQGDGSAGLRIQRCPARGGVPTAIDAALVVRTGILPQINTGIAGKVAGTGQVGAGLLTPPLTCFTAALNALANKP